MLYKYFPLARRDVIENGLLRSSRSPVTSMTRSSFIQALT